jgi:CBS domain-containing protein
MAVTLRRSRFDAVSGPLRDVSAVNLGMTSISTCNTDAPRRLLSLKRRPGPFPGIAHTRNYMKSSHPVSRRSRPAWSDLEEEITTELHTLAAFTIAPMATVGESTRLAELRSIFVEQRVPAIAVVDAGRSLCGLVTRTDLLRVVDDPEMTAADVMSGFIFSLPLDSTIECAAALMATEGVGQIVVTTPRGELAGMVSALDIARHVAVLAGYLAA